jgi:O-6-methylguanine DNA methyltransferase
MTFRDRIYEITKQIPKGKVVTYGQLAALGGSPKAARAVGMCMRTNPNAPVVPCHRVVASDGSLTGYSMGDGVTTKKKMLEAEGVIFNGDKVNLSASQWNLSS